MHNTSITNPPKCTAPTPLTEPQFDALSLEMKMYYMYLEEIEKRMAELKAEYCVAQHGQSASIPEIAIAIINNRFTNFVNAQKQELFPNT